MLSSLPDLQKERGFSHTSRKKKLLKFKRESTRYLLGCLNSKLLSWYFLKRSNIAQRDDFPKIVLKETRNLPIRSFNFSDPADKARHDKMVELVDRMLELNKQKHSGKLASSQVERLDREIVATDAEIDGLVYELYSITDEDRRIVESTRVAPTSPFMSATFKKPGQATDRTR
jgi:hypothetical protein